MTPAARLVLRAGGDDGGVVDQHVHGTESGGRVAEHLCDRLA